MTSVTSRSGVDVERVGSGAWRVLARRSAASCLRSAGRAALALAVGVGCSGLGGCQSGSSLPAGSDSVRVAEGRHDASITMSGVLQVELLGYAGTGFEWELGANDPSLFEAAGAPHVTPLDPGVIGGRTITTYTFRPLRPGKTTLVFNSVRPREWNEPPGSTVQVEATVHGGGT